MDNLIRLVLVTLMFLTACSKKDELDATAFGAAKKVDPASKFCPADTKLDGFYCKQSNNRALGPFNAHMVKECNRFGGGLACGTDSWDFVFALSLRGNDVCPKGTWLSEVFALCTDGSYAYGPFDTQVHEACLKIADAAACDSMRLDIEVARKLKPAPGSANSNSNGLPSETSSESFEAANTQTLERVSFYATNYFTDIVDASSSGGYPLLGMDGSDLGVKLSRKNWCGAAMEGSIIVRAKDGTLATYNYASLGSAEVVDCSDYATTGRARFSKVSAPYGLGINGYNLVPYRSLATSQNHIRAGTVIYIPEARGVTVTLPNGKKWAHDGYFMAADVGDAIEYGHIDVFTGTDEHHPFEFVTSDCYDTRLGYVVTDPKIIDKLRQMHR